MLYKLHFFFYCRNSSCITSPTPTPCPRSVSTDSAVSVAWCFVLPCSQVPRLVHSRKHPHFQCQVGWVAPQPSSSPPPSYSWQGRRTAHLGHNLAPLRLRSGTLSRIKEGWADVLNEPVIDCDSSSWERKTSSLTSHRKTQNRNHMLEQFIATSKWSNSPFEDEMGI